MVSISGSLKVIFNTDLNLRVISNTFFSVLASTLLNVVCLNLLGYKWSEVRAGMARIQPYYWDLRCLKFSNKQWLSYLNPALSLILRPGTWAGLNRHEKPKPRYKILQKKKVNIFKVLKCKKYLFKITKVKHKFTKKVAKLTQKYHGCCLSLFSKPGLSQVLLNKHYSKLIIKSSTSKIFLFNGAKNIPNPKWWDQKSRQW